MAKKFGIYCGKQGWVEPDGDAWRFSDSPRFPFATHPEAILFGLQNRIHTAHLEVVSCCAKCGEPMRHDDDGPKLCRFCNQYQVNHAPGLNST